MKVYTSPSCMECQALKTWLKSEGIDFKGIDISVDQDAFGKVVNKTKEMKVPTIEINKEYIVGFDRDKILDKIKKVC